MSNNVIKCETYGKCALPKDNKRYSVQAWFSFLAAAFLIVRVESLTFVSILVFIIPFVLDVFFSDIHSDDWKKYCQYMGWVNWTIVILCILGVFGWWTDTGKLFMVHPESPYFPGYWIEKRGVAWVLLLEFIIPNALRIGAPCQLNMNKSGEDDEGGDMP